MLIRTAYALSMLMLMHMIQYSKVTVIFDFFIELTLRSNEGGPWLPFDYELRIRIMHVHATRTLIFIYGTLLLKGIECCRIRRMECMSVTTMLHPSRQCHWQTFWMLTKVSVSSTHTHVHIKDKQNNDNNHNSQLAQIPFWHFASEGKLLHLSFNIDSTRSYRIAVSLHVSSQLFKICSMSFSL